MLTIGFANLKPGTGKTTSAVWLAHAFPRRDPACCLADADPAACPAMGRPRGRLPVPRSRGGPPGPAPAAGRLRPPDDVVVIDCAQIEDHARIARSAMRAADEIVDAGSTVADRDSPVGADGGRGRQARVGGPRLRPAEPVHLTREQHRGRTRRRWPGSGSTCSPRPCRDSSCTPSPSAAPSHRVTRCSGHRP